MDENHTGLITLDDATMLDQRQTAACTLRATTKKTNAQIAKEAGYASGTTVSVFLNSTKGREGVQKALTYQLLSGAIVGFQTMLELARGARSETVRQLAAADLMNRAGFKASDELGAANQHKNVSITINLDKPSQYTATIEGTADE